MDETGRIHQSPDFERLRQDMYAISISDAETKATIKQAYNDHDVLLEPHGAVAWAGLSHYFSTFAEEVAVDQVCVSIETAHPAKFPQEIREVLGIDPELPPSLEGLEDRPEHVVKLGNTYEEFTQFLREHY